MAAGVSDDDDNICDNDKILMILDYRCDDDDDHMHEQIFSFS